MITSHGESFRNHQAHLFAVGEPCVIVTACNEPTVRKVEASLQSIRHNVLQIK